MTVLAPIFLAAAALGALAVVAMHFLARRRPPAGMLPTARFVPDRAVRATSRSPRPTDLLLLALRVLVVLLVGAAFAGIAREPARRASARVILVDRSRAVGDAAALRDSAIASFRDGDVVVLADSAVVVIEAAAAADSLRALVPLAARGALAPGLVAAQREAVRLATVTDSVRIVVVSPFAIEVFDSATLAVRRAWPGEVRTVRVPMRAAEAPPRIAIAAGRDDPVAASVALLGLAANGEADATVRIVRGRPDAADSVWVAGGVGLALVVWPSGDGVLPERVASDTIGAVAASHAIVVAPFVRRTAPGDGRVVARWVDGAPAATERPHGSGCERDVAIPVASRGDLALRPEMLALVRALAAPCGGAADVLPAPDSLVARLAAGDAASGAARRTVAVAASAASSSALAPWLLGAALLLALAEPAFRRARRATGDGS